MRNLIRVDKYEGKSAVGSMHGCVWMIPDQSNAHNKGYNFIYYQALPQQAKYKDHAKEKGCKTFGRKEC